MARFYGAGSFTLPGISAQAADLRFENDLGLISSNDKQRIFNCEFSGQSSTPLTVNGSDTVVEGARLEFFDNVGIDLQGNRTALEACSVDMSSVTQAGAIGISVNAGDGHRVIGCEVVAATVGDAAIEASGDNQVIQGNTIRVAGGVVGIHSGGGSGVIKGNTVVHTNAASSGSGGYGILLGAFTFGIKVSENWLVSSQVGIASLGSTGQTTDIKDNTIWVPKAHGIQLNSVSRHKVTGNLIIDPGDDAVNTYDGIFLEANCDECTLMGNIIEQSSNTPRYAINIANANCNDNVYVGNRAMGTFGTGKYNNVGTGSINTWPGAGGAQGDNL